MNSRIGSGGTEHGRHLNGNTPLPPKSLSYPESRNDPSPGFWMQAGGSAKKSELDFKSGFSTCS
jgi:hypothetical protein